MPQGDQSKGSDSQENANAAISSIAFNYNRRESPTQTSADAVQQQTCMEIWGRQARGGSIPCVKAYRETMPTVSLANWGGRGVLFNTIVPAYGKGDPFEARWYDGYQGVIQKGNGFVAIPVSHFLNLQP
jgi:hypothetical protein